MPSSVMSLQLVHVLAMAFLNLHHNSIVSSITALCLANQLSRGREASPRAHWGRSSLGTMAPRQTLAIPSNVPDSPVCTRWWSRV